MSSLAISGIVFAVVFGGAVLGMLLRSWLPEHHLAAESADVVKLGMGLIATITALVLSLLIASAKNSYDSQRSGLAQLATNVGLLDRMLARYGPEAKDVREQIRAAVGDLIKRTTDSGAVEAPGRYEYIYQAIEQLQPKSESQRSLQSAALKTCTDTAQARWNLFAERGSSVPAPFLVVMVFWLAMLFASFSLFATPNATVVVTLMICALSVAGAVFLILELDQPFVGLIRLPTTPLTSALGQLGK